MPYSHIVRPGNFYVAKHNALLHNTLQWNTPFFSTKALVKVEKTTDKFNEIILKEILRKKDGHMKSILIPFWTS